VGAFYLSHCFSIDAYGSYVYALEIADFQHILHVIDVSNPDNPIDVGTSTASYGNISGPIIVASYPNIYFSTGHHSSHGIGISVDVIDVTDPENPTGSSHIGIGLRLMTGLSVSTTYGYIASSPYREFRGRDGTSCWGLLIFDLLNPYNPYNISHGQ